MSFTISASQFRCRRSKYVIESPNDGLNRAERVVYEAMCDEVLKRKIESRQDELDPMKASLGRNLAIGYGALCQIVPLRKRSLQRVVARLIQKKFISIKSKPSGHQESTTYCVHTRSEIELAFRTEGWQYWRRVGAGIQLVAE
jgi:hypothetical protein